ncbi:hypothetical protein RI844_07020 [Thalassotalea fonticola]|uniref:Secreted protein n=1 Tax=Thalassotalea fonticola TaxID=3065649 RepID=A0ABZ0GTF9_9GAMM|nr:hypothetical protein RI844_07020 [Colwelliaceae bacterium S1-1]
MKQITPLKLLKPLLILMLMPYMTLSALANASEEESLIKGFAQWQASRVEKILINEVLEDITEDPYTKRFFSSTSRNYSFYESSNAQRLIPLLQHYIKVDIDNFEQIMTKCIPYHLDNLVNSKQTIAQKAEALGNLMHGLRLLSSKIAAGDKPYTVENFNDTACVGSENFNGKFTVSINEANLKALINNVLAYIQANPASSQVIKYATRNIRQLNESYPENYQATFINITEEQVLRLINHVLELKRTFIEADNLFIQTHQLIVTLETIANMQENDYPGFNKFKNAALLFSSLAQASKEGKTGQVVAILDTYIDEQDAYMQKRSKQAYYARYKIPSVASEGFDNNKIVNKTYTGSCSGRFFSPCKGTIFLSSYYGISAIYNKEEQFEDREINFRAFGPIGFEFKAISFEDSILSLNIMPLDIGNYITNELKQDDYSAKFDDILAPSVFISYTSKSKPFAVLFGFQDKIKVAEDYETNGIFLSLVFDLPIYTIY